MFESMSTYALKAAIRDIREALDFAKKWDDYGRGEAKYESQLREAMKELRRREGFSRNSVRH
jgi:hypothetical protein